MSLIEIARLSDRAARQARRVRAALERAQELDRALRSGAAEAGVEKAYAAAGLSPPREIVWGGGPLEIANAWARSRDGAGDNVRSQVIDQVCRRAEGAVDRTVGLAVRMALAAEPRLARVPPFCSSIDEAVLRDCERVRPQLRRLLASLFDPPPRRGRRALPRARSHFTPPRRWARSNTSTTCATCSARPRRSRGLWQIAKNASWMLPHRDVCWLAERPELMRQDARGRLHCGRRTRASSYPRRLVGLRLEGRAGAALDHRAARAR